MLLALAIACTHPDDEPIVAAPDDVSDTGAEVETFYAVVAGGSCPVGDFDCRYQLPIPGDILAEGELAGGVASALYACDDGTLDCAARNHDTEAGWVTGEVESGQWGFAVFAWASDGSAVEPALPGYALSEPCTTNTGRDCSVEVESPTGGPAVAEIGVYADVGVGDGLPLSADAEPTDDGWTITIRDGAPRAAWAFVAFE